MNSRSIRQGVVTAWAKETFGRESVKQRAIRMLEEAIELYQAAGGEEGMAHDLAEFVFKRPVGNLAQEAGGLGVTLLVLCEVAGLDADEVESIEVSRIRSKPIEHFVRRNDEKNAAGFRE